jgi:hypothetical protein
VLAKNKKVFCGGKHALFVTLLANFLIFAVLPFSQRSFVYISRIFRPNCLLVKIEDVTSMASNEGLIAGLFGFPDAVFDRTVIVPLCPLGVRAVELEAEGWW